MNKRFVAHSILYSLVSPIIVGLTIACYYTIVLPESSFALFFQIIMSAVANAHIVGLTMAICVVPGYLFLFKRNKVTYSSILTIAMLGGALFSYVFSASGGVIFLVNTVMSLLAAGIFLYTLRRQTMQNSVN